jgi:hypothetical protein
MSQIMHNTENLCIPSELGNLRSDNYSHFATACNPKFPRLYRFVTLHEHYTEKVKGDREFKFTFKSYGGHTVSYNSYNLEIHDFFGRNVLFFEGN